MKGLIIKDLLGMRSMRIMIIMMFLIYTGVTFWVRDSSMLEGMALFVPIAAVPNSFSLDRVNKWDAYLLATPISRKIMVHAKYAFAILLLLACEAAAILIRFGVYIAAGIAAVDMYVTAIILSGLLIMLSIMMPLTYRFGENNVIAVIAMLITLPLLGSYLMTGQLAEMIMNIGEWSAAIAIVSPLAALAIFAVSSRISIAVLNGKEY